VIAAISRVLVKLREGTAAGRFLLALGDILCESKKKFVCACVFMEGVPAEIYWELW
jgi:hypothetical protein